MILVEQLSAVAELLLRAANSRETASFGAFHSLFDPDASNKDKYDTLEAASRALCPSVFAIYGAVLAKKGTGCPGDGFYDAFKNIRPDEYKQVAGECLTLELMPDQMLTMAFAERERVYTHAETHFQDSQEH